MVVESEAFEDSRADNAARLDAAEVLAVEGFAVMASLRASANLVGGLADITQATKPLIQKLLLKLRHLGEDPDIDINIGDSLKLLGALAFQLRQANAALHEAQKIERLHMGEPSEIVGHVDLSDAGRQDTLERAERALEMARRAEANLRVVGGKR